MEHLGALPQRYEDERWDNAAGRHVTVEYEFTTTTRDAWARKSDAWANVYHVAFRWAVLFDRFMRTGAESVSAELRQLEKVLTKAESDSGPEDLVDVEGESMLADMLQDVAVG